MTAHAVTEALITGNEDRLPVLVWGWLSGAISFSILNRFVSSWKQPILIPIAILYSAGWIELWRQNIELACKQGLWLLIASLLSALVVQKMRHINLLERHRELLLFLGIGLLFSVLLFGTEVNGAKLWLRLGPLSFQPIELVKLLLVIVCASFWRRFRLWLKFSSAYKKERIPKRGTIILILGWMLGLMILVVQRDLGMALLLIGVLFTLFYVAVGKRNFVLVGVGAFFGASALVVQVFAHVRVRIRAWWDPFFYRDSDGYQMVQGLYAIADGGPWGRGIFEGKPYLVPEAHNDFIFVAISQELGWLTSLGIIFCCAFLGYHFFSLAQKASGSFRALLLTGLASLWCLQCFIIISGVTKVIPMTGLTLPFVSYGGSSMLANVMLVGLIAKAGQAAKS